MIVAQNLEGPLWSGPIRREMGNAGYTDIAISLALRSLAMKRYIDVVVDHDQNGNEFPSYSTTDAGFRWLEANKSKLTLHRKPKPEPTGDEIPF